MNRRKQYFALVGEMVKMMLILSLVCGDWGVLVYSVLVAISLLSYTRKGGEKIG